MKKNSSMMSEKYIECSPMLVMEGYKFIQNRCRKLGTNIFQGRLLGKKVIFVSGADAAKVFYNAKYFKRKGVAPKIVQKTLFGENGVQGLDGPDHDLRKFMFMTIMTPQNMMRLNTIMDKQLHIHANRWVQKDRILLFDQIQELLTEVACQWAGVPLSETEIRLRADDMGKMVDGFGSIGSRFIQGMQARKRSEVWMRDIVNNIRKSSILLDKECAAYIIAWHRNAKGELLSPQIAAVELINIIRPIVAIATYITFGSVAMEKYKDCYEKLQSGDEEYAYNFVQEVRRFYPFAPFVGAIVKKSFTWKNNKFAKGTLTIFDIYGTNHDSKIWDKPNEFRPERFKDWKEDPYSFVPQGGGDPTIGHRCAGEMVTIQIMKECLLFLANKLEYKVPVQ
ncbi:MAG TPA: cytochrome P450, partial [Lachnospiraceae bacterium]|nr:cytochrome P450 [Lachnospiraceae bacterium]